MMSMGPSKNNEGELVNLYIYDAYIVTYFVVSSLGTCVDEKVESFGRKMLLLKCSSPVAQNILLCRRGGYMDEQQ